MENIPHVVFFECRNCFASFEERIEHGQYIDAVISQVTNRFFDVSIQRESRKDNDEKVKDITCGTCGLCQYLSWDMSRLTMFCSK